MPSQSRGRAEWPGLFGDGRISYICRDHPARASAAACLKPEAAGRVYELTGPQALSVAEVAEIITRLTAQPVRYEPATDGEFAEMCREPGIPDYLPDALVTLYRAAAQGCLGTVTNHVEELTGAPAERLESYLERNLA